MAAKTTTITEPKGGIPVPRIGKAGLGKLGYQRNPDRAAQAVRLANFKCEIDASHNTFISSVNGEPYVEAHHLIPFSNQGRYPFSLDVTANIVALCPNCHRRLHHANSTDKASELKSLFSQRKARLAESELVISENELLSLYKGILLEDEA